MRKTGLGRTKDFYSLLCGGVGRESCNTVSGKCGFSVCLWFLLRTEHLASTHDYVWQHRRENGGLFPPEAVLGVVADLFMTDLGGTENDEGQWGGETHWEDIICLQIWTRKRLCELKISEEVTAWGAAVVQTMNFLPLTYAVLSEFFHHSQT